jgi:hypothetical protein
VVGVSCLVVLLGRIVSLLPSDEAELKAAYARTDADVIVVQLGVPVVVTLKTFVQIEDAVRDVVVRAAVVVVDPVEGVIIRYEEVLAHVVERRHQRWLSLAHVLIAPWSPLSLKRRRKK